MTEIEITEIPPLSPGEQSLLDFHSVVNVINVLHMELVMLGLNVADDERLLGRSVDACLGVVDALRDREKALAQAARVEELERLVEEEVAGLPGWPATPGTDAAATVANMRSVFAILKVRARELLARAATPERWEEFDVEQLRANFVAVFAAIEQNSKGRYRILYNAAQQGVSDYYVDFKIEVPNGRSLFMPPVLQDVMRDLIANARKYTVPGGHITAAFYEDADAIRFVVRDTGRGIPPEEITKVVGFGMRASNVGEVRTLGGGFGLTKAFLVTKQFGGRFWIASAPGQGTQVRLWIPRPGAAAAAKS
ncbi:MAG: ATP-binding protein [Opitutaceae bacterium]|nr:ATP-binding protein [Opitutaceae bacterium]